jgi:valyl-tRNA synthetase
MSLAQRHDPATAEPRLQALWAEAGIYDFDLDSDAPVYSIDTPPATVSGHLHLGHVYSYSQTDFIARYQRMRGRNVYYPMGFDDNGLPTERLVEKTLGFTAAKIGRQAFIDACLEMSVEAEASYRAMWQRLGLSVDWRYTYRTIDTLARRTSQRSFLEFYREGLAYRTEAPAIWCPECHTAIAQADLEDLERETEFFTLAFALDDGTTLPIATTRAELLPACVAIFVHPADERYRDIIGRRATTPFVGLQVPILADPAADPAKGTGAVMCCTFGDSTDLDWWRAHELPLRAIIGRDGRLTDAAGTDLAGLTIAEARARVVEQLEESGKVLERKRMEQSVRAHERCDTPVEYIIAKQWFIRVLDDRDELLDAADRLAWHPATMASRYRDWVENLRWDWCISRQRSFGVPFPVWYCTECGEIAVAADDQLPIDPAESQPRDPCPCGSTSFQPEEDVMDTWATSSMSPQIAGRWLSDAALYERVFPFTLRAQAHEIIRTWTFYTLVKSLREFGALPWSDVAISGWGVAPRPIMKNQGDHETAQATQHATQKISKSRGGGPIAPEAIFERYSADATRYWAASTGPGKDAIISEEKIRMGAKLVTKVWNVARFAERFDLSTLPGKWQPASLTTEAGSPRHLLLPADRWLLSRLQRVIERATASLEAYDYAAAKSEIESFFWTHLTDNYLELAKERLYGAEGPARDAARYSLSGALETLLKLFAPFMPYVTEEIFQGLFVSPQPEARSGEVLARRALDSIHRAAWPAVDEALIDEDAERAGDTLVALASAARRFKSEAGLSLGTPLARLTIVVTEPPLADLLSSSLADLRSVTRARTVTVAANLAVTDEAFAVADGVMAVITRD